MLAPARRRDIAGGARGADGSGAFASLKAQIGAYVHCAIARPSRYQLLFAIYPIGPETTRYLRRPAEPVSLCSVCLYLLD